MSTRSLVGIKSESGLVGRYVHSDGYPDHMAHALRFLIERDGAAKVGETILAADKGGWSYLMPERPADNYLGADRAKPVEGYGLMYLDAPDEKMPTRFDLEFIQDSWCEFAYFIDTTTGDIEWYDLPYKPTEMPTARILLASEPIPESFEEPADA